MIIGLPVSSLKNYLNRSLIFLSRAKIGLSPLCSCILLKDDKAYVDNGETGAIVNFPFSVTSPTLLFPFDLAKVVNSSKDDSQITIDFDYQKLICTVKSENIEIKVKLIDPTDFKIPSIPDSLQKFPVEKFYDKIKNASFCCHIDASLPLLQGVSLKKASINATDQRVVWVESSNNEQEFIVPNLLKEHIEKLDLEPKEIACTESQIFLFYNDMVVFGAKLAEEDKYPNVERVFLGVDTEENKAIVSYDNESLKQKLEMLLSLSKQDAIITIQCKKNLLSIQNVISDPSETQGVITLDVSSTNDFENVIVKGEIFLNGVIRFTQFAIKANEKLILFWNETQKYCVSRRNG